MRTRIAVSLVVMIGCCWPASAEAAQYHVTRLPGEMPVALNDWATVVGWSGNSGYVWKRHSLALIPSLYGADTQAVADINNNGMVVGTAFTQTRYHRGFAWTRADGVRDLGGPRASGCYMGYEVDLHAAAVNDRGLVVGRLQDTDCDFRAVSWDVDGMHYLSGLFSGAASDVNSSGVIIGYAFDDPERNMYGFVSRPDHNPRLLRFHNTDTQATGINDNGVVVGWWAMPGSWVLVPGHRVRTVLGDDLQITNHRIFGLSPDGWATWNVLGRNRHLIRLPHGWQLDTIVDANNRGQFIGTASRPGDAPVSVLVRPAQRPG
jgi:probable HAF family extracellular repeat protein